MIKITFNSKKAFVAIFGFLILSFFTVSKANAEELKVSERGDGYQAAESSSNSVQPAEDVIYGERLRTDSAISVGRASYFYEGFHTRGVIFANNTIINTSLNDNGEDEVPVTFGDDVRIDGEIWRGTSKGTSDNMPLKFSDTLVPTRTNINDFGSTTNRWKDGYFSGAVTVGDLEGANIINEENLNVTNSATSGQVLSYSQDGQFTWIPITGSSDSDGDGTTDGILPAGTSGQTLRYGASGWEASSLIYNDGTDIDVGGGFGDSGVTIYGAGGINADGALSAGSLTTGGMLTVGGMAGISGNALFGGGYSVGSGVTIYDTGALSMNGNLLVDGHINVQGTHFITSSSTTSYFGGQTNFGGGYGSTGVTIENTGDLSMDGNLLVDGTAEFENDVTVSNFGYLEVSNFMEADTSPNDASIVDTCDSTTTGRIIYFLNSTGGYNAIGTGFWGCKQTAIGGYSWVCLDSCS